MGDIAHGIKALGEFLRVFQVLFIALGGGLVTWFLMRRSYAQGNFRRRLEFIGVEPTPHGIDFHTHGPQMDLNQVVALKRLEDLIVAGTKRMNGDQIIRLPKGTDQRRMMEVFEDWLTGNDPRANAAAVKQRSVHEDEIGYCPTFYHEEGDDAMIRVYVFDPVWLEQLLDEEFFASQKARKKRFSYRMPLLRHIANERASERSRSGDTAAVWHTVVKTAKTDISLR